MLDRIDQHTLPYLFAGLALMLASMITFYWNKKWGIRLLMLASGVLGFFMASLDPYLNLWDEQQHALVAKNMAENPFKPMLYKTPLFEYDYKYWIANHVWIHKQPLFLWQMALFIKIFGAKVMAVRMPSIILHAILPYLVYRIGRILKNDFTGFVAALFVTLAFFPLELVAGRLATDHNDMSFLFYVTWSVLCWLEYQRTQNKRWLIWLGVSAGCAVLVKWLMGLLVYVIWFLVISIINKFKVWQVKQYFVMIKPFVISLVILLPWQIYCFIRFPKEAQQELVESAAHFSKVIEGHDGPWNYHLDTAFEMIYFRNSMLIGSNSWIIIFLIAAIGIWRMKDLKTKLFAALFIAFVYIFFSLAATKMLGFTLIALPLMLIALASAIDELRWLLAKKVKKEVVTYFSILALTIYPLTQIFQMDVITKRHSLEFPEFNDQRALELYEHEVCLGLEEKYGDRNMIFFNANITMVGYIPIMFHTDYLAYAYAPNEEQITTALDAGYEIVVFDRNDLDPELKSDPRVEILAAF